MCCTIGGFLGSGESIRGRRRDVFKARYWGLATIRLTECRDPPRDFRRFEPYTAP